MNIMKNFLTQCTKIIAVTLIIGWGVSAVDAWTAPIAPPPGGTVKAPEQTSGTAYKDNAGPVHAAINVSSFDQIKKGILSIVKPDGNLVSPLGFFKNVILPKTSTSVYIGGTALNNPSFTGVPTDADLNIPLTINTVGRESNNALRVLVDPSSVSCPAATPAIINTDATAFRFANNSNTNTLVDIFAKGIRLSGGNPAKGKILISVDNKGKAVWATPKLDTNGKDIIFDTTVSPVGMCQPPIGNQGIFEWRMSDWGQCVNGKQQQTGVCWDVTNNTQATDSSFCSGTAPTMERGCTNEVSCPAGQSGESGKCLCTTGNRSGLPPKDFSYTAKIVDTSLPSNEGELLVPAFVLLDQVWGDGGQPGTQCIVVPIDSACNDYDFNGMNEQQTFTFDGDTFYKTEKPAGRINEWKILYQPGSQCTKGTPASGQTIFNIVKHP